MVDYLKNFPKPLLDDLIANRWLPLIGAGFSKNAKLPDGKTMPDWDGLAKALSADLNGYEALGTLDLISAYCHEFSRSRLIEKLYRVLNISESEPSVTHESFCKIPFDVVLTTNFDFLLERQYDKSPKKCVPVVSEDQLSVNSSDAMIKLIKIHGDLHHPQNLIVTEEDYESFIDNQPLLGTYVSSLLIARTAVLIGYSLDDPDFRQIWRVVSNRLGRLRRPAYALLVNPDPSVISRFDRRGVKVISLPGSPKEYPTILSNLFRQIYEYWINNAASFSQVNDQNPSAQWMLNSKDESNLCFVSVPQRFQSIIKEELFPLIEKFGYIPVFPDSVIAPGDNLMVKVEALIRRSALAIIVVAGKWTTFEASLALHKMKAENVILIADKNTPQDSAFDKHDLHPINLNESFSVVANEIIEMVRKWLLSLDLDALGDALSRSNEFFKMRRYDAAIVYAFIALEQHLRGAQFSSESSLFLTNPRPRPISERVKILVKDKLITDSDYDAFRKLYTLRNYIVHTGSMQVSANDARNAIALVQRLIRPNEPEPVS